MSTFERRDNTFEFGKGKTCFQRFSSVALRKCSTTGSVQVRMHGTDARVIKTCRNAVRLYHLPVCGLHYEAFAAVQNTGLAKLRSSRAHTAVDAATGGFYRNNFHTVFVKKMIKGTRSIAATAHAGNHMRRQFAAGVLL